VSPGNERGEPALKALVLDYLPVTDKSLESLKKLTGLRQLSLDNTGITDRGAEILQSIPTLHSPRGVGRPGPFSTPAPGEPSCGCVYGPMPA
jgi:hypothetical protein